MSEATRVAVYARISEDASGEAAGVERQLHDARELAALRGWSVIDEFHDNDVSALTGRNRPGYEALRARVARGGVDHVLVWQTSRLWRNRAERARDIEALGRARIGIIAVKGPSLDLSTAYGRGMAGLLGEFDTMESEVKSERVAAAAAQRARDGRPNGDLGYGWRKIADGSYEVEESEAAVVREIVERLAARETVRAVTADLNARGVPAPKITTWGKTSVRKLALRESNVSIRVHHRGRPDESRTEGAWPPLVERKKWEALRAILTEPSRRTNQTVVRPGARRHLLTWGIGECGVCGGKLRVSLKGNQRWGTKQYLYLCEENGCTGRNQARVDELVRLVVIERLSRPDALDWLMGDEDAATAANDRAVTLKRRLDEAADQFADGAITIDQLTRITERLTPQIEEAEAERQRHAGSRDLALLDELSGPRAAERWDEMSVTQQRAVVETLGMRVIIDKVTKRGPGFDPTSVRIEWRKQ